MIRGAGVGQFKLPSGLVAVAAFGGLLTWTLVPFYNHGSLPAVLSCHPNHDSLCGRPGVLDEFLLIASLAARGCTTPSPPPAESETRCPHSLERRPSSTLGGYLRALEHEARWRAADCL
jgi:hypothetical protein